MLALVAALLGAVWTASADAPTTAPALSASVTRRNDVKVEWSFTTDAPRNGTSPVLQRSDNGSAFVTLKIFDRPRARSSFVDRAPVDGVNSYRAQVTANDQVSPWSAVVTVGEPTPPTTGGPVPTPVTPTTTPGGNPPLPAGLSECQAGFVDEVLRIANVERAKVGLFALKDHPKLAAAARQRSIDQAAANRMSHDGWVATIRAAGYNGGALGENIAYGYGTPAAVMSGWMGSSGHRANLLNGYVESGVGCVRTSSGRIYWTHDFGA